MFLFFINKFNDIDHISPIVYELSKTNSKILILSLNPFVDLNDFRLRFLKKISIKTKIVHAYHLGSILRKIIFFILHANPRKHSQKLTLSSITRSLFIRSGLYQHALNLFFDEKWAAALIDKLNPKVMIFDHAATSGIMSSLAPTLSLINSAKNKKIKIISVPHGVPLFIDHPDRYKPVMNNLANDKSDLLILQHKYFKNECVSKGFNLKNAVTIGLARFSPEWRKILKDIVPISQELNQFMNLNLNVVFMDSGPNNYGSKIHIAQDLIDSLYKCEFINFLYKPHTRTNKNHLNHENLIDTRDINSVNLIRWADVIIGTSSSIMIEALLEKKYYISPIFLREKKMIFEKYGACKVVNSINETIAILNQIKDNSKIKLYDEKDVNKFIKDIVFNGEDNNNILKNYCAIILRNNN